MHDDTRTSTLTVKGLTPYAQIPKWVLRNPSLSHGAVRLYGVIMSYADNSSHTAFPSRDTLATDMGVTDRSIGTYIKELEKAGAMAVTRRRNRKTGNFYANHYVLHFEDPVQVSPAGLPAPAPEEEYFLRREEENFPITKPTNITTSTFPVAPESRFREEEILTPSTELRPRRGSHIHEQIETDQQTAQHLISLAVDLYETGNRAGCSTEWDILAESIDEATGYYVGDQIADKNWDWRLAEIIEQEEARGKDRRYGAGRWLAQLINHTRRWAA